MRQSEPDILFNNTLSLTAVLVNESRGRRSDISGDIYARDWIPARQRPLLDSLWNEFADEVYGLDDIVVSIRNRYFATLIETQGNVKGACVVLLACGLTSYPYITKIRNKFLEYDLKNLILYKRARARMLLNADILEKRDVDYNVCDIADSRALGAVINSWSKYSKRVIIVEGISYYLETEVWRKVMASLKQATVVGDIVAFDFWPYKERNNDVYQRYAKFCAKRRAFRGKEFTFYRDGDISDMITSCRDVKITSVDAAGLEIYGTKALIGKSILKDTVAVISI